MLHEVDGSSLAAKPQIAQALFRDGFVEACIHHEMMKSCCVFPERRQK